MRKSQKHHNDQRRIELPLPFRDPNLDTATQQAMDDLFDEGLIEFRWRPETEKTVDTKDRENIAWQLHERLVESFVKEDSSTWVRPTDPVRERYPEEDHEWEPPFNLTPDP
jgi:hypothetical protein